MGAYPRDNGKLKNILGEYIGNEYLGLIYAYTYVHVQHVFNIRPNLYMTVNFITKVHCFYVAWPSPAKMPLYCAYTK